MQAHDPIRQITFIQQALSQNRKPIGFFIGAGCPLSVRVNLREENGVWKSDPLIWDVAGLTQVISQALTSGNVERPSTLDRVVQVVKDDGEDESNIELLLSKIRVLRSVAGKGKARELLADELDILDNEVCRVISEQVSKALPRKDTAYHNLAIWTRSVRREKPVHLFTTNYDLLMEQALEESAAPYFDGFVGARKAFFDLGAVEDESLLPPRWARLWKIHGSLNWRLVDGKQVVRSDEKTRNQSYLIYPSHLKCDQSRKMPYLAMLDRLKAFLLAPSALLFVSGYSFSDEHINDVICRSLESNPTSQVFAFVFGKLDEPKYALAKQCAFSNPNLSLLAFDKAIIGRNEGKWNVDDLELVTTSNGVLSKEGDDVQLKLGDFAVLGH